MVFKKDLKIHLNFKKTNCMPVKGLRYTNFVIALKRKCDIK